MGIYGIKGLSLNGLLKSLYKVSPAAARIQGSWDMGLL